MGHFHIPLLHSRKESTVPRRCIAIKVGKDGQEEKQRVVIPLVYLDHPLFTRLLDEADEAYGLDHKGGLTLPCSVFEFGNVQRQIDRDIQRHHEVHGCHGGSGSHHRFFSSCFRA